MTNNYSGTPHPYERTLPDWPQISEESVYDEIKYNEVYYIALHN